MKQVLGAIFVTFWCIQAAARTLDINLVVFDPGLDADPSQFKKLGIFPEIRQLEARYLPFVLREELVNSDRWGAVRVLPAPDPESELQLTGKILKSDGVNLSISVKAIDATGRVWLENIYNERAADADYQSNSLRQERPFAEIYQQIAKDLNAFYALLDDKQRQRIEDIALLRYAHSLAPDAFAGYVELTAEGRFELRRLPAENDPMLARIQLVREKEYVFIDTVDEQYATLFQELGPTYDLWRQFNREQALYQDSYEKRLAERKAPKQGSYDAMKRSYLNFKWAKVQEQESARLAEGFSNETRPTFIELEDRVVELNGSLDSQYQEWRRILRSIFELENAPS